MLFIIEADLFANHFFTSVLLFKNSERRSNTANTPIAIFHENINPKAQHMILTSKAENKNSAPNPQNTISKLINKVILFSPP